MQIEDSGSDESDDEIDDEHATRRAQERKDFYEMATDFAFDEDGGSTLDVFAASPFHRAGTSARAHGMRHMTEWSWVQKGARSAGLELEFDYAYTTVRPDHSLSTESSAVIQTAANKIQALANGEHSDQLLREIGFTGMGADDRRRLQVVASKLFDSGAADAVPGGIRCFFLLRCVFYCGPCWQEMHKKNPWMSREIDK